MQLAEFGRLLMGRAGGETAGESKFHDALLAGREMPVVAEPLVGVVQLHFMDGKDFFPLPNEVR